MTNLEFIQKRLNEKHEELNTLKETYNQLMEAIKTTSQRIAEVEAIKEELQVLLENWTD